MTTIVRFSPFMEGALAESVGRSTIAIQEAEGRTTIVIHEAMQEKKSHSMAARIMAVLEEGGDRGFQEDNDRGWGGRGRLADEGFHRPKLNFPTFNGESYPLT
ncbi:hypothetical protein GUJ93_ZPchr0001g32038 [Zizania palustris]|uniref:Uncharacterized protein n=1 Tax=Zizania palustris TaxID=103762 RepID=A0A8J5RS50_ZIZPA|nr:hypothetical protein GUJ93_ZPchr0001g32038 [Zizania palustris]